MTARTPPKGVGFAMLAIGIAFLVLGITGQRAFLGVGPVFLVIGMVFIARANKRA